MNKNKRIRTKTLLMALSLGFLLSNPLAVAHASEDSLEMDTTTLDSKDFYKQAFENAQKEQKEQSESISNENNSSSNEEDTSKQTDNETNEDSVDEKDLTDNEKEKEDKDDSKEKENTPKVYSTPNFNPTSYSLVNTVRTDQFRFFKVSRIYSFANKELKVFDSTNEKDQKEVGILKKGNVAFILSRINDKYSYIESGDLRGFVENKYLDINNENFNKQIKEIKEKYKNGNIDNIELKDFYGKTTIKPSENKAFDYLRITTKDTLIKTKYFINKKTTNVKEEQNDKAKDIGVLEKSSYGYIIEENDKSDWVYIESGKVRGFVKKDDISYDDTVQKYISENGLEKYQQAKEKVDLKENKARFYSLKSTKEPIKTTNGEELVEYAKQFIGNPYVWGGTDPVNGADCSGFTGTIYKRHGYNLPRTAEQQAYVGKRISLSEAKPGDLLFNMDSTGYIYHVTMYAGNGRTVEAANPDVGIINGNVLDDVCWGTRILEEKEVVKEEDLTKKLNISSPSTLELSNNTELSTVAWQVANEMYQSAKDFSKNKKLTFDDNGFGILDNRYVVSVNKNLGQPRELIDIYLENGTIIPSIIGSTDDSNYISLMGDKDVWNNYDREEILKVNNDWNSKPIKITKLK